MDTLAVLQRRERMISIVRWLGVAFAFLQFTIYQAPSADLVEMGERVRPYGYGIAVALAVVAILVEVAVRTVRDPRRLAQFGGVFLVADVAAVMGIVYLYTFDPISATWAIMAFMPLEGALRFQLPGALGVWATFVVFYPLRETLGAALFDQSFEISSVVYRLGVLLVIALFAGFMARDLDTQLGLLRRLNSASRELASRLEPAGVLETLCREAYACLGARNAVVYAFDGETFQPVASWPRKDLEVVLEGQETRFEGKDGQLARGMLSVREPVWLERDDDHPGRLAVPMHWQADPVRNVLVIEPQRGRLTFFEREVASALAESAALALATSRVLAAEQRSNRRLRNLEALRTRFVATVAHDLRLPLTVFKGVSKMLRRREDISPAQVGSMLDSVERQSNRLSRLVDDLLDAARMDADRLELHTEPCDLASVVDVTVADAEEEVEVTVEGDMWIVADTARLERVVWNLLSNAEKYGKPPFQVRLWREDDVVLLEVRDHGPGLEPAQQERLYTEFASSGDPESVGLGLAIVWQLVTAHGGEIHYEDADPGARFVVSLPVDGPPAAVTEVAGS